MTSLGMVSFNLHSGRMGKKSKAKVSVGRLARQLCMLYHEAVRAEVMSYSGAGTVMPIRSYDDVDKTAQRAFRKAAKLCVELKAKPIDFIASQFARWRDITKREGKVRLPMPPHLSSAGAHIRYAQWKAQQGERNMRRVPVAENAVNHREQRRLNGLSKMHRKLPEDVLCEMPEEFSREFLQANHVWDLVQEKWHERRRE